MHKCNKCHITYYSDKCPRCLEKRDDDVIVDALVGAGIGVLIGSLFSSDNDSSGVDFGGSSDWSGGGGDSGGGGASGDW